MSLEKTLVILKPSAVQRGLIGEITSRFERKGLRLAGMKMMQLTDDLLNEHYAHLAGKPFFQRVKDSMMASPVVVCCYEGVDAVQIVRSMTGATNAQSVLAFGMNKGVFVVIAYSITPVCISVSVYAFALCFGKLIKLYGFTKPVIVSPLSDDSYL